MSWKLVTFLLLLIAAVLCGLAAFGREHGANFFYLAIAFVIGAVAVEKAP